jgi:hypothetical protein
MIAIKVKNIEINLVKTNLFKININNQGRQGQTMTDRLPKTVMMTQDNINSP